MDIDQTLAALRAALATYQPPEIPALPGRKNDRLAGVLVALRRRTDRLVAVAGLRRGDLSDHAGEICFPGGKPEAGDADLCATALREAAEELAIGRLDRAAVIGRLAQMPLYTSDYRLAPFVAELPDTVEPRPDGSEIVELFEVDLLAELERHHLEGLPFKLDHPRPRRGLVPLFRLRSASGAERVMYGATACTCFELLAVLARATGRRLPPMRSSALTWHDLLPRGSASHQE